MAKKSKKKAQKVETKQVGGNHYARHKIEPWDFIAANKLGYFEGNVVKYVVRWPYKGGIEDLYKARHYLDKLIEEAKHDGYS